MLVQPYWVLETVANFQYFNLLGNNMFTKSRYVEPIARSVLNSSNALVDVI